MALPAWRPADGTIADVGLSTPYQVGGADTTANWYGVDAILSGYCGVAYAPWYGDHGSIIMTGGGHGNGVFNAVYRYDVASRLSGRIKSSALSYMQPWSWNCNPETGWMFDAAGNEVFGEPFAAHQYNALCCVPDTAINGGDGSGNGWFISQALNAAPILGQGNSQRTFKLRMGVDQKYSYHGLKLPFPGGSGRSMFYDSRRNKLIQFSDTAYPTAFYYSTDVYSGAVVKKQLSMQVNWYYSFCAHDVESDLYILSSITGSNTWVINPRTGQTALVTATGNPPPFADTPQSAEWVQDFKAMSFFNGQTTNAVYFLKMPAGDPFTQPWEWVTKIFTGTLRARTGVAGFRHHVWISTAQCFIWATQVNVPMQAISFSAL